MQNNQPQEEDNEESSVIGKELIFPDVDPEELDRPIRKRQIIDEYSSNSDSEESFEAHGTTRIKSKNEQSSVKEPVDNNQPAVTPISISEAAKLREKRPSAVAAVQAIAVPQKKKTPLKGAAVKAPLPPKEKKPKKQDCTEESEEKAPNKRGTKRKADEVSRTSESDTSGAVNDEPARKRLRAVSCQYIQCSKLTNGRHYRVQDPMAADTTVISVVNLVCIVKWSIAASLTRAVNAIVVGVASV